MLASAIMQKHACTHNYHSLCNSGLYQWWACEFFWGFTSSQWLHLCGSIDWINKIINSKKIKEWLLFLLHGGRHLISETNVLPFSDSVSKSSCGYFILLKRINKERIMNQTRLERKCYCVFRFGEFLVILFFFTMEQQESIGLNLMSY